MNAIEFLEASLQRVDHHVGESNMRAIDVSSWIAGEEVFHLEHWRVSNWVVGQRFDQL